MQLVCKAQIDVYFKTTADSLKFNIKDSSKINYESDNSSSEGELQHSSKL